MEQLDKEVIEELSEPAKLKCYTNVVTEVANKI